MKRLVLALLLLALVMLGASSLLWNELPKSAEEDVSAPQDSAPPQEGAAPMPDESFTPLEPVTAGKSGAAVPRRRYRAASGAP